MVAWMEHRVAEAMADSMVRWKVGQKVASRDYLSVERRALLMVEVTVVMRVCPRDKEKAGMRVVVRVDHLDRVKVVE